MKEKKFNSASQTIKAIKKQKHTDSAIEFIENNTKDSKLTKGLEKTNKSHISKLHAYDYLKNGAGIEATSRYGIYEKILSEEEIYSNQLDSCQTNEFLSDLIRSHVHTCDTPQKEEILLNFLKKKDFQISNGNLDLLWESPVVLHYFLSNPNISNYDKGRVMAMGPQIDNIRVSEDPLKEKKPLKKVKKQKAFSFAPEPVSDELLSKIGEDIRNLNGTLLETGPKENNSYIEMNGNLYIALAGLKNGDLPAQTFYDVCLKEMAPGDKNMSIKNLYTALEACKTAGVIDKLDNKYISNYILMDNGLKYKNKHELEAVAKLIKMFEVNPFLIDPKVLKRTSRFFRDNGIITQKDLLNIHSDIGGFNLSYDESFELDEADSNLLNNLNYDPKPTSYKEAIIAIRNTNKKVNELTFDEANIFLIFTKKILEEKGVYASTITFDYDGIKLGYNGSTNKFLKEIKLTINDNSIEDLMHTIFHEANHLIQYENCKKMNIYSDTDLIEFAQDDLMRLIDKDYYNRNYPYLSKEFDADFSAYLQTAELFSKSLDDEFEKSLNVYSDIHQYYKVSNRLTEQNAIQNLNTLFSFKLRELHDTDIFKYLDIKKTIINDYPILAYEYDLETGLPRTIEELVDMVNSFNPETDPMATKKISECKYVINARCSPDKVGVEIAEYNRNALKEKLSNTTPEQNTLKEIEETKDKFEKYQNLFNQLTDNMNKQTAKANR